LENSDLTINQEAMGTTEPVNAEDSIENESYDSLGGMAKRTRELFFYSERSWTNPTTKIDIERVNIRPRRFYFIGLINFGRSYLIKNKTKLRIPYNVIKKTTLTLSINRIHVSL